jgi:hypothetical protein
MSAYIPLPYNAINFDPLAVLYIPLPYDQINFDPTTVPSVNQFPWLYFFAIVPQ